MKEAVLSLGSNLNNREENIKLAMKSIGLLPETRVVCVSNFYETVPFGVKDKQNKYINCCLKVETELNPHMLLGACLGVESALGRVRPYRFAPRVIDIDLIFYEDVILSDKHLTLPHPRWKERPFVLIPLCDIFPDFKFKLFKFELNKELYDELSQRVSKININMH